MCVFLVAPVFSEVLFPEFLFVLLDFRVNLCVECCDVGVFVVLLSKGVSLFYEFANVFREQFVFVVDFSMWYVMFVCC